MSRSTINNRRFALQDAYLTLRELTATAIAATTAENPIQYNLDKLMYFKAVVTFGAYTGFAAGTAEWDIFVEVSADGVTYQSIGNCRAPGNANIFYIPFEGMQIADLISGGFDTENLLYVRCRAVKTGTPGNLMYGVYLTC